MSKQIFVRPAPGLVIRHPEKLSHILSSEGEFVTESIDWHRYINAGDVTLIEKNENTETQKELK